MRLRIEILADFTGCGRNFVEILFGTCLVFG